MRAGVNFSLSTDDAFRKLREYKRECPANFAAFEDEVNERYQLTGDKMQPLDFTKVVEAFKLVNPEKPFVSAA
jgi:hypothetical protein